MIAINEQLPLLRLGSQEVVHYEESWVHDILTDAARRTGMDSWFMEDIARGVVLYLKQRFPGTAIDIGELFEKLDKTLRAVGFEHVAGNLEPSAPPANVCLKRLAENAGDGYELVFFQKLRQEIHFLCRRGANRLHCKDIRHAAQKLCQAKRWSPKCEQMQQEILDFVAKELARISPSQVTMLVS